jgi:hypothetical protein
MATTMAIASPHSRTTNTPPIVLPFDDLVVGGRWSVVGGRWGNTEFPTY